MYNYVYLFQKLKKILAEEIFGDNEEAIAKNVRGV